MKAVQKLLYMSFLVVFLLFAVYGCQTTNNAVTSEFPISEITSDKTESDAESIEQIAPQTNSLDKESSPTSVTAEKEAEMMKKFGNNFIGRLSGHGGALLPGISREKKAVSREEPAGDSAVKSADKENRPYIDMEKQLYGKWINKIETESYDFHDDGTVSIAVSGKRGRAYTLHGHFRIVEAGRIKIDFIGDALASQMPPRYFKLSLSENAFSLTDEPKKKGGPDGPTTIYNRVE